jgi:hypothetical protein
MPDKSVEAIKKAVIADFEKLGTGEKVYSKVFSLHILTKYATLLYKLYQKSEQKGKE